MVRESYRLHGAPAASFAWTIARSSVVSYIGHLSCLLRHSYGAHLTDLRVPNPVSLRTYTIKYCIQVSGKDGQFWLWESGLYIELICDIYSSDRSIYARRTWSFLWGDRRLHLTIMISILWFNSEVLTVGYARPSGVMSSSELSDEYIQLQAPNNCRWYAPSIQSLDESRDRDDSYSDSERLSFDSSVKSTTADELTWELSECSDPYPWLNPYP